MSKKLKLSPWHDGSVKPVHVGVYERNYRLHRPTYTFWDGELWRMSCHNYTDEEIFDDDYVSPFQGSSKDDDTKWRGVLK